ncbi:MULTISPECIES: flagellar biosynthetic protein FliO [Pseudomonas]|uniref:flagellar biosynthetic protein FliO n=1 Tax=Pseudomonas TaxID=286 RepID=UPI0007B3F0CA|nr:MULTISPECIES: flagellar biosynthetic protein FliO [Pseudomonas]AZC49279.1 Flagellar biosynthesis protein FliO [Pseudomonas chlororaphis subsp. piscium]AZC55906.1 Flagellar biosynthesis protein FliO [Pseudomonas chlororaphis subsp. piscium]AZC62166.1 Flagellar biosynthesis protein FliO [Pseudomonas chlororaphis subsp. piscium]AZC68404.1 Flagellar biosynthesis protein FliO [Pseudomonas chlororaphis subsp. piscium]AZC74593.1 Flagellar biosynthesis protein FliO [Pseudomonas chlororaphis subsp. 
MRKLLALFLAWPLWALAAEPAASTAAPVVGSSGVAGQLTQLVLGLLLVVGLIFFLAWLLRRVQQAGPAGKGQVIELVGSRALGPRDRLMLVQVGNEQILLGLTPGTITALHVLKEPVQVPSAEQATPEFAQRLMELLGKDQKDKK